MAFEKHCWAEIDLGALRSNFSYIKRTVGGPVCTVVKADAYGHGDIVVANTLQQEGAAAFAVSCLAEALHLRHHGIIRPIIILGYTDPAQAAALAKNDIIATVFSTEYAQALSAAAILAEVKVNVHLKVDTGMGRIGFSARAGLGTALPAMESCYALPGLKVCGIFQHFAVADSNKQTDLAYSDKQYHLFLQVVDRLRMDGYNPGVIHCANSAMQLRRPERRCDMTRAGIILYGLNPSDEVRFPALRPVMTLKSVISQVKTLHEGESVSYGRTFTAKGRTRVATVCVGYADGYPRQLSGTQGQGLMLVNGRPAPVLGRICMDQTMIDVTNIPGVKMGDEVTVFGPGGGDTADSVAQKTNTINYEVVCGLSRRVPRVYTERGAVTAIWNDLEEN